VGKAKRRKREPNGRLSRKGMPRSPIDKGTERAQEKMARYGQEGADAIGRAYMAGLLGENRDALKDTARKVFRAYWPMLAVGSYKCALNDAQGSANYNYDREALIARERWLTGILRQIDRLGAIERRLFDELVININPDHGPAWLDSLIWHKAHNKEPDPLDVKRLETAISALNHIVA
jgi:hypothetical protein